jgi:hypothetical protein
MAPGRDDVSGAETVALAGPDEATPVPGEGAAPAARGRDDPWRTADAGPGPPREDGPSAPVPAQAQAQANSGQDSSFAEKEEAAFAARDHDSAPAVGGDPEAPPGAVPIPPVSPPGHAGPGPAPPVAALADAPAPGRDGAEAEAAAAVAEDTAPEADGAPGTEAVAALVDEAAPTPPAAEYSFEERAAPDPVLAAAPGPDEPPAAAPPALASTCALSLFSFWVAMSSLLSMS